MDMAATHPHADARYRVISRADSTFGVEVTIPDTEPTTVSSFATALDAEAWISAHKERVARGAGPLRAFRGKHRR